MSKPYDENNQQSILEYAKKLEGITLREVLSDEAISNIDSEFLEKGNKGRYGQKIEKYYFEYQTNTRSSSDFPCGLELKATPLRYLVNGNLTPKERLVCNIIKYKEIIHESWESSTFLDKNSDTLIIRYIDPIDKSISQLDYEIFDVQIFNIFDNDNDAKQFEEDWNVIVNKIRNCKAHLLSESDTKYLGACTKGSTALKSFRQQPCGPKAKQRAFSFKQQYMKELLSRI